MTKRSRLTPDDKPSRRRLLKVLAGGGAAAAGLKTLPPQWTQPALESVMLPAHAQTSPQLQIDCSIDDIDEDGGGVGTLTVTVSGSVSGGGDLGGIQIDIEGVLTESGTADPTTEENESTTTAADGSYGPVDLTFDGPCLTNGNMFPFLLRDGVRVTVTSPDSRLEGESSTCTAGFTKCPDPS